MLGAIVYDELRCKYYATGLRLSDIDIGDALWDFYKVLICGRFSRELISIW